ncbi:MAG: helix-turn-helix domain-containing protein [Dehalococcoidia bacterium]
MSVATLPAPPDLTVPEVANRLQISQRQVYRLITDGALPTYHLGRLVRIPAEAFEAWRAARIADVSWSQPE